MSTKKHWEKSIHIKIQYLRLRFAYSVLTPEDKLIIGWPVSFFWLYCCSSIKSWKHFKGIVYQTYSSVSITDYGIRNCYIRMKILEAILQSIPCRNVKVFCLEILSSCSISHVISPSASALSCSLLSGFYVRIIRPSLCMSVLRFKTRIILKLLHSCLCFQNTF